MDRYLVEHKGCYACPIRCSRKSRVSEGPYAVEIGGPEYETTNALGPMCWIDDPEAIIYANHLCNLYGLDTISTGVVVAFAMELHEKGLLDDPELSLEWGDVDTLLGLIERIAYRRRGSATCWPRGCGAPRSGSAAGPSATPCTSRAWSCPARSRAWPRALAWATPPAIVAPTTSTPCRPSTWAAPGTWPSASFPPRLCPS